MLMAGQKIGDLRKVLPACRQLLKDAVSQTRGAINYLVILTFVITPLGICGVRCPEGGGPAQSLGKSLRAPSAVAWEHAWRALNLFFNHAWRYGSRSKPLCCFCSGWRRSFTSAGRVSLSWFPVLQRLYFWLPWRRKRMQRDFSTMLAILLDSGVPEPEAVAPGRRLHRQQGFPPARGARRG